MDLANVVFVALWPGWLAGAAISGLVVTLLLLRNRQLSVSFCYGYITDRVTDWSEAISRPAAVATDSGPAFPLPSVANLKLPKGVVMEPDWSMWFLAGIFMGGLVAGVLSRRISGAPLDLSFAYAGFDALWKLGPLAKAGLLFAGGLLVGFGTRMAGGCTSGHAIVGAPALQKASLLAMCAFLGTGTAVAWILHFALGGVR